MGINFFISILNFLKKGIKITAPQCTFCTACVFCSFGFPYVLPCCSFNLALYLVFILHGIENYQDSFETVKWKSIFLNPRQLLALEHVECYRLYQAEEGLWEATP